MKTILIDDRNYDAFEPIIPPGVLDGDVLAFGAMQDDAVVGVCVVQVRGNALNIAYLWVSEDFRERGCANAMLDKVNEVRDKVYKEYVITSLYDSMEEYAGVYDHMFIMRGYEMNVEKRPVYIISRDKIMDSPITKRGFNKSENKKAIAISDLSKTQEILLEKLVSESDGSLIPTASDLEEANKEKSYVLISDNRVSGILLVENTKERGVYTISYAYLSGGNPTEGIAFFRSAIRQFIASTPDLHLLMFTCVNEGIERAVKTMFGEDVYHEEYYINEAISA